MIALKKIKIYKTLYNSCTDQDFKEYDTPENCETYAIDKTRNDYVDSLLKKLHLNFKKIYLTANNRENSYFRETAENVKEYCVYFKYWLYDEILSKEDCRLNIEHIYKEWEKKIHDSEYGNLPKLCAYNKLKLDDIEKLKSIYAFTLIFYNNINIFNVGKSIPYKYLNDLGKGLKAYSDSISRCSIQNNIDTYCEEFKEFLNVYKLNNLHLIHSTENTDYQFDADETVECPLVIESLKEPLLLMYKEGINRWYLSDQPIHFLNTSVISASSAIGAIVGISSFLVYLFKFTNIRSLFSRGKQDDNAMFLNIDEGTHDFTYPFSEPEHNNFGNSTYNISYYSVGNSKL
ncbi:PIR Superfamily Protein [Plasmodium ovale curtisi]|uniref:PIR Superfamily Protein n=1 Tax=Plasmodium ovale curtisi TaxID=864141 RepID=A0A1A8WAQ4_PLAOA|nr:PIR Superfamily Protein [Plasmodium ovale curtisi]SBT02451.1 PIR Superfamily Protein [Plasmodium ovale curtisi]